MNRRTLNLAGMVLAAVLMSGCAPKQHVAFFGEPFQAEDASAIGVTQVLADPEAYRDRTVLIRGKVAEVCRMRGCWMTLTDDRSEQTLFVRFTCPIEGRLVPLEATGHEAMVQGKLVIEEISEPQARHIAEDAGQSAEEVAKIVGPQKQIRLASPSAKVIGLPAAKG